MSQGDIPGSPKEITNHHHHQILITKASSSPPRSRSQSTGSAHQEALLFFEKHQLFKAEGSSPEVKVDEESLIRKRSVRGRSHSQPSQVLLSTGSCRQEGGGGRGGGALENLSGGGSEDLLCGESGSKSKYTSSWLEQITSVAQYHHYRTNDYSSVVNSASSLDKVLDQGATPSGSGVKSNLQQQIPCSSSSSKANQPLSRNTPSPKSNHPPLCFHFPKVKLPRIFNAKSLDDIFGSKLNTGGNRISKHFSSTTSSSTSPYPHKNPNDPEESSQSSVGITTPGITNTTGGTTVTETGFTTTSGYFSDLDRRESCDLLVIDQEDHFDFGDTRRNSSLTSAGAFIPSGAGASSALNGTYSFPPLNATLKTSVSIAENSKPKAQEKSRKHSGSSITSTLTSALLRIPERFNSPKNPKTNKSPCKKPTKSLSSRSLNRITVFTSVAVSANGSSGAKTKTNAKITSDNYLNRTIRFGFGKNTDETLKAGQESTSILCVEKSDKNPIKVESSAAPQQRKWLLTKQKWDLKLQLKPQEGNEEESITSAQQHLLFVKAQLGNITEIPNNASRSRRSLDELESFSFNKVQPHEPGRVSFCLEPQEIPRPVINRSQSTDCKSEEDNKIMTKSQHFHYISKGGKSNKSFSSPKGHNQNVLLEEQENNVKEKAKLVVANVSFLQRPTSPCVFQSSTPTTPTPTVLSPNSSHNSNLGMSQQEMRPIGENINKSRTGDAKRAFYGQDSECCDILSSGKARSSKQKSQSHFGIDPPASSGTRFSGGDYSGRFDSDLNNFSSPKAEEVSLNKEQEELPPEEDTKMGDLQSPTYVKKTAHMFNSIYSSQQNGSSSSEHNPSYLNVSKSVSGYSCLSYNNNATNGTVTNGNSTKANGTSSASPYSHRFINSGGVRPSSKVRSELSIKASQNQNQASVTRSDVRYSSPSSNKEVTPVLSPTRRPTSPPTTDPEETDSNYVPSHGKSFIMQRIERLYGSDAVSSAGVISRKTISPSSGGVTTTTIKFESSLHQSPSRGKERVIPIKVENGSTEVDFGNRYSKPVLTSSSIPNTTHNVSTEQSLKSKQSKEYNSEGTYERCFRGDEILEREDNNEEQEASDGANTIMNVFVDVDRNQKSFEGVSFDLKASPESYRINTVSLEDTDKSLLTPKSPITTSNGDKLQVEKEAPEKIISPGGSMPLTKSNVEKDGNYFLQEMRNTTKELQRLSDKASPELETLDQQSERAGNILAAVGKSNLLIKKKFKQFEELCQANLRGVVNDEPPTTDEDLAGFWDMVTIQVEQVYSYFKDIEENNSEETAAETVHPKTSPRRIASSVPKPKPAASKSQMSDAAKAREESRRKMLAEKRRQMQDQGTKAQEEVLIFTPENN